MYLRKAKRNPACGTTDATRRRRPVLTTSQMPKTAEYRAARLDQPRTRAARRDPPRTLCGALLVGAVKGGRHLAHEARHLVLHLLVRLEPDVEVENYLGESGGLHFLQGVRDPLRRAQQHRVLRQVLGFDLVRALDHADEVAIARRRGLRIAGQRRDHAFAIIADLARALRVLLR